MTFLSACNTPAAEKRLQYDAFKALERPEEVSTKEFIDVETVASIRAKFAELHIVCMEELQQDITSYKQLDNCRRYLALATLWGCSDKHQPMRCGDWPSVLLDKTSDDCNYLTLDPVTVHMRQACKVGKVHQDTNLTESGMNLGLARASGSSLSSGDGGNQLTISLSADFAKE